MNKDGIVVKAIRQNLSVEEDDKSMDGKIASMNHHEQLERFLTWHGIIGYSSLIRLAIEDIYNIKLEN